MKQPHPPLRLVDGTPDPHVWATWTREGDRCRSCTEGRIYSVILSEPCRCGPKSACSCIAHGYGKCDYCPALVQIHPRHVEWTRDDASTEDRA